MANCRGCGAEILWAQTTGGKRVPLDAKPERRFTIVTKGTTPTVFLEEAYLSHFATCPKAGEFRKERQPGEEG